MFILFHRDLYLPQHDLFTKQSRNDTSHFGSTHFSESAVRVRSEAELRLTSRATTAFSIQSADYKINTNKTTNKQPHQAGPRHNVNSQTEVGVGRL